ncbi:hypothetical protein N7449_009327 [Penicillium cf. viridicatum]|uniref:Uncharacterized protein n=1 Tax=Penicillium cf. viridicatum TaxID=2972119 RepID=A0A9W9JDY5_9EURO|nr:hypothetical protein N7449_009327 [Penicillium cf. viridicatum]
MTHTTIGCGKQGFPSAQPYLSHTPDQFAPSLADLAVLKVRYNLLKSMDHNIEADLSTVTPLPCVSDVQTVATWQKQPSPVEGINPPTSGPSLATPPLGPAPYQTYQTHRALAQERHESHLGDDDVVRNVEKMMKKD